MKNNKGLKTKLVLLGLIITIILAVLIQPLAQSLLSNSKTANLDDHVGMMQENLIVDSLRFSQSDEPVYNPDSNKYFMTIQAAIDDPLTQNGHCIFVSAGVYDENICVHKELKIIGAGADITLVQAVHPYGAVFSIPASHVTIQGFQLTGATEQDSAGIRIGHGSHENSIFNNIISENYYGIYIEISCINFISNNEISNNMGGIIFDPYEPDLYSSDNIISNNDISYNYDVGISLESCVGTVIFANHVTGNTLGILVNEFSHNTYLSENYISGNCAGLKISSHSSNNIVSDNWITESGVGIEIEDSSHENSISYNYISTNEIGVIIKGSFFNIIEYNEIMYNHFGFVCSKSSCNKIVENDIFHNVFGIYIDVSDNNIISKNDVSNNGGGIILKAYEFGPYSCSNIISENHISYNYDVGISLELSTKTEIIQNDILYNNMGILITDMSFDNHIYHNVVIFNDVGIEISTSSYYNDICDNTIAENRVGIDIVDTHENSISSSFIIANEIGIKIQSSCSNVIKFNEINQNQYGIVSSKSYHTSIIQNNVLENEIGVYIDGSDYNIISNNDVIQGRCGIVITAYEFGPHSTNNIISQNFVSDNYEVGISLEFCAETEITDNKVISSDLGIFIGLNSCDNIVSDNTISKNYHGIIISFFSSGNNIHDNFISDSVCGIIEDYGSCNRIHVNYIKSNYIGISLYSTSLAKIHNNIITDNTVGLSADDLSSDNSIFLNLFINNDDQIQVPYPDQNIWCIQDPDLGFLGNFWSNYWGKDLDGDYIGDTDLPHEEVDWYPLLDPSIPEKYGPLPYADWWFVGRGGSTITFQVIDPYGRIISVEVNEIGLNAFYVEELVGGSTKVMILIAINPEAPVFGTYTCEITAQKETTYSLEWYTSAEAERLFKRSVEEIPLKKDQTDYIGTVIEEPVNPGDPPPTHSLDENPPEVSAEIIPFNDIGKFRIEYSVTDDYDPDPTIIALLKLPLPEDLSSWKVKLKVKPDVKFSIYFQSKDLVIKAPNPVEIWDQIIQYGGMLVENGEVIKVEIDDMVNYNSKVSLEVMAMDASANKKTVIDVFDLATLYG